VQTAQRSCRQRPPLSLLDFTDLPPTPIPSSLWRKKSTRLPTFLPSRKLAAGQAAAALANNDQNLAPYLSTAKNPEEQKLDAVRQ